MKKLIEELRIYRQLGVNVRYPDYDHSERTERRAELWILGWGAVTAVLAVLKMASII